MAKLSYNELKSVVSAYVVQNSVSYGSYTATRNNIANLLDKIGKITTLDTNYTDKLALFDGEVLNLGKDVEEWSQDLILPTTYDSNGTNALSPNDPTYRPPFYSKSLGRKQIKTTIRNDNLERAVNNVNEFNVLTSMIIKRLYDSEAVFKYNIKREILKDLIFYCNSAMNNATSTTFSPTTSYQTVGTLLKDATTATAFGILVKGYTGGDASSWSDAITKGYIIKYDLITKLAKPVDTATGEAFIKQLKADVEIASDVSEGHSLNGNSLGATDGLVLIMLQGIRPVLDVDTYAGAFNKEDLTIPSIQTIIVPDFAGDTSTTYAILMDSRMVRLFNSYRAIREGMNADGDFINYVLHTENTAYVSRNAFVKIYKVS